MLCQPPHTPDLAPEEDRNKGGVGRSVSSGIRIVLNVLPKHTGTILSDDINTYLLSFCVVFYGNSQGT
jgi:hypothetical protein